MDWRIPVLPPDTVEKLAAIFKVMPFQCKCDPDSDVDWMKLAKQVEGYNGGDLRGITKMALEVAHEDDRTLLTQKDYEEATDDYLPPKVDADIARMIVAAIEDASSLKFLSKPVQDFMRKKRAKSREVHDLTDVLDQIDPDQVRGRSSPIKN